MTLDSAVLIPQVPEQGQLVEVRRRQYIVTDVLKSVLPPSPLTLVSDQPQHLITLSSIEDDALGEELRVIWELEPGARIREQSTLPEPTGFDSPRRLDAFLDAVRWGAASFADVRALLAPFRSGIELEDYQLDPLVRAVQMPRVSLLIADDVGLGKTIEAGLVIQELIVRNRARTVLIVCPSALQAQWRDQMRDKFGLEFRIVDTELMKKLRRQRGLHINPWTHFPRLITSVDFLKRDRPLRLMREALPAEGDSIYPRRFDILVVDEAHNVAPSGHGNYAIDSMRTGAIRALTPHFEHKFFLTATPHNGYTESFTALLELLDHQRFARGIEPDRAQLGAVMVRRLKSELPPSWDGKPRFPKRHLEAIEVDYSDEEREVHAWLQEYSKLRQQNVSDSLERYAGEFVLKLLKKRLFSSPLAFLTTLEKHEGSISSARRRGGASTSRPTVGILRQQIERVEEEHANDDTYEGATDDAVELATRLFRPLTSQEAELIKKMKRWAETASARMDNKTKELLRWLEQIVKPDGKWSPSGERVIIFTEYRATQNWLQTIFAAKGLASEDRLMTLYGGMEDDKREAIKAAFQASPDKSSVRILLATDAASEGIDLQNYCHRLIHFEIPWNPNRLEQRNGRVDRHGQKHDVLIYHFVAKGFEQASEQHVAASALDADLEFLMRAAQKVEQIREDLGKVGPVIAAQVEEAMLGKRTRLDTEHAERGAEPARKLLKFERNLKDQIAKHYEQLRESRETMRLAPENVKAVVDIALELKGLRPLAPSATVEGAYIMPPLTGSWATCAVGLEHPHTKEIRPIVFDHNLARGCDDVVLAHLNHRLVQMSLRLLRAEVWSRASNKGLHRVTVRRIPDRISDTPLVIAFARLVMISGDSQRLHEEIITAGGYIREGRFKRMEKVSDVQEAIAAASDHESSEEMKQRLAAMWDQVRDPLTRSLEARMKERADGVGKLLTEREWKETVDIQKVMNELAASIDRELDRPEYQQMALVFPNFSDSEREQLNANVDFLRLRLEQIPKELEKEKATIKARYANPSPRMFPVAVMFLVPEKMK